MCILRCRALNEGRTLALVVVASCIWPIATASLAHAQADITSLRGTVTDVEGPPLEGARVHVTALARGTERETETNDKGEFLFRGLHAGEYEVLVEKEQYQGFKETIRLRLGPPTTREYQLKNLITPAHAAFNRGIEAFQAGNLEEAAQAFEESVALAPEVVDGHANLAATYARLGREEDALRELEKVIELSPDSFRASAQLAATYAQMNRFDEAIETLETALAMEFSDPGVHDAWVNLGTLYFMGDRTRDAIGAYEKALVSNPSSATALLSLGKCHFNLGETDEAIARFQQVVDVAPESNEASEAKVFIAEFEKSQAVP